MDEYCFISDTKGLACGKSTTTTPLEALRTNDPHKRYNNAIYFNNIMGQFARRYDVEE